MIIDFFLKFNLGLVFFISVIHFMHKMAFCACERRNPAPVDGHQISWECRTFTWSFIIQ